jgi:hypothetical protein
MLVPHICYFLSMRKSRGFQIFEESIRDIFKCLSIISASDNSIKIWGILEVEVFILLL